MYILILQLLCTLFFILMAYGMRENRRKNQKIADLESQIELKDLVIKKACADWEKESGKVSWYREQMRKTLPRN